MVTDIFEGEQAFEILSHEWDALAVAGMTDTPFQQLAYQSAWWRNLQPRGAALYTLAVRDADDLLTGIAVLYLTADGILRFNGCVEETDYLDLIARAEDAHDVWTSVFDCLFDDGFPSWRRLELCNIPETSPTRTILPEVAAYHRMTVVESVNEVCPVIELPSSFDAYLESLDSKQRRETKRKLRRAAGAEAALQMLSAEEDPARAVEDFLDLLQKSTFEKRDWLNEGRRTLFHETAQAAQKNGTLQLLFLVVNGKKAAALFNFDYADRIWVYNSGLDPELFAALSPGVVITALAIEKAIEDGRSEFDFLRGDEEYKYRFGAKDTAVYRLQLDRQQPD
jgi:CelD/BcsL family acetyltransferase involved in cellulose biosynthesis